MVIQNFEIDEQYLTNVVVEEQVTFTGLTTTGSVTPEQRAVMEEMMDKPLKVTKWIDHPEFTKLREQLEADGYIKIERSWWNGDKVLKPFKINGISLKKNGTFYCAVALGNAIGVARNMGLKSLGF